MPELLQEHILHDAPASPSDALGATLAILDALPDQIAVLDRRGVLVAVNAAWREAARANGAGAPHLPHTAGTHYLALCDAMLPNEEVARQAAAGIQGVLAGHAEPFALEYARQTPHAGKRWFALRAARAAGDGGAWVIVTHADITRRVLLEDIADERGGRVHRLLGNTPESMFLVDDEQRIVEANRPTEALLGYVPEALTHLPLGSIVVAADRERVQELWRQAHAKGNSHGEIALRHRDGTVRHVELLSITNVLPGLHLLFVRDVTALKRSEAALRQSAERLRFLREIEQAILAERSPKSIGQATLRHIKKFTGSPRLSITLFNNETSQIEVVAAHDESDIIPEDGPFSTNAFGYFEALIETLRRGQPYIADIAKITDPWPETKALLEQGLRYYTCVPLIIEEELIGSLQVASKSPPDLSSEQLDILMEMATPVAVSLHQARLYEQINAGHARLLSLSRRLVETQETERRQIAQALHDQAGQQLTVLNINLHILRDYLSPNAPRRVVERIDECERLVGETMEWIRSAIADLRPTVLDDYGLASALRWYAQQFADRTELVVLAQISEEEAGARLAPEVETALFRIAQEALTNIAKHARVRRASVRLQIDARRARLEIADEGVGFASHAGLGDAPRGLGLTGMRERIESVGGHLLIQSAVGKGTRVIAEVRR